MTAGRQQKYIISPQTSGETYQYMLFFSYLSCCDSCCIYVLDLNVMGLSFVLVKMFSDSKWLCLLRAKIKDCFFFRNRIFLADVFLFFVCVAVSGQLIPAQIGWSLESMCTQVILTCANDRSLCSSLSVTGVGLEWLPHSITYPCYCFFCFFMFSSYPH